MYSLPSLSQQIQLCYCVARAKRMLGGETLTFPAHVSPAIPDRFPLVGPVHVASRSAHDAGKRPRSSRSSSAICRSS